MKYAIGLMSGTSLDGVDACLVRIEKDKFEEVRFITLPYKKEFREKLFRNLYKDTARLDEISMLNFELGSLFKRAIDKVLEETELDYKEIDFVASHGQTIWHAPNEEVPSTLQIGESSVISFSTNIRVVSDFRVMDVAAGGEGAPLVPFSEFYLYDRSYNLVLLNIGGISNFTYFKKEGSIDEVIAFDCGPGNIMIDYYMNYYYDEAYDKDGAVASEGKVVEEIFQQLRRDEFILKRPPKSTGRERYSIKYMTDLMESYRFGEYKKEDIIATITEFSVYGIFHNLSKYIPKIDKLIVNGGGSKNFYIMKRLQESVDCEVVRGDNADSKEAIAFVFLAYNTLNNKTSNLPSVTGASSKVILGKITPSPRSKEDFDGSRFKKDKD